MKTLELTILYFSSSILTEILQNNKNIPGVFPVIYKHIKGIFPVLLLFQPATQSHCIHHP